VTGWGRKTAGWGFLEVLRERREGDWEKSSPRVEGTEAGKWNEELAGRRGWWRRQGKMSPEKVQGGFHK